MDARAHSTRLIRFLFFQNVGVFDKARRHFCCGRCGKRKPGLCIRLRVEDDDDKGMIGQAGSQHPFTRDENVDAIGIFGSRRGRRSCRDGSRPRRVQLLQIGDEAVEACNGKRVGRSAEYFVISETTMVLPSGAYFPL
jgi:hypothetical protein